MDTPLINGIRHSWASIRINLLGRTPTGITAVSYSDSQEMVNNYGAGIYAVSRGVGPYEATAKITLHAYEADAIQKKVVEEGIGTRLQQIPPFDVVVTYLPEGSDDLVTHVIRNCQFKSNKREVKQGDTVIEIEYELICSHIEWV